jgi:hypothetical protein
MIRPGKDTQDGLPQQVKTTTTGARETLLPSHHSNSHPSNNLNDPINFLAIKAANRHSVWTGLPGDPRETSLVQILQGFNNEDGGPGVGPGIEVFGRTQRQVDAAVGAVCSDDVSTMDPDSTIDPERIGHESWIPVGAAVTSRDVTLFLFVHPVQSGLGPSGFFADADVGVANEISLFIPTKECEIFDDQDELLGSSGNGEAGR